MCTKCVHNCFDSFCKLGRLQMCAVLYNKSFVHAIGYNNLIPHVNIFNRKLYCPSTHAEIDAIRKVIDGCRKKSNKKCRLDMVVLRKNVKNEYCSSKPCKHCLMMLQSDFIKQFIHIRNITYYEDGKFITEPLNSIETEYVSTGWSHYYDESFSDILR